MKSQRGFTLLEFIVVISIISILAGLFLQRVPLNQELAEKSAMEQTAAAMQSALVMRYGSLLAGGNATASELKALSSDNPISWLQQEPNNYAGEFFDPGLGTVKPGQWVFDLKSRDLIYVLDRSENFTPGKDGQKWIRFHVKFEYDKVSKKQPSATLFAPATPYRWFD